MTTYTVTHRADDGSIATLAIEAADRAACMAACRARGITPLSIKEGGQKGTHQPSRPPRPSQTSQTTQPSKPRNIETSKLLILLLVLLAVGGLVWFFFFRAPAEKVKDPAAKPKAPKAERGTVPKAPTAPKAPDSPAPGLANAPDPQPANSPTNEVVLSVITNRSGYIVERVQLPDGTTAKRIHTPPPVFDNVSDQMIAMVVSVPPGQAIPPLPHDPNLDEAFAKSLGTEIKILETDTSEVRELKAAVLATRVELAELVKKGYTVQQALDEHCRLANENADVHAGALVEMKALLKAGDLEGAQKYAERINAALKEMGAQTVPVPQTLEKGPDTRAERARERREQNRKADENEGS